MGELRQVFRCKHGADLFCQVCKFMTLHRSRDQERIRESIRTGSLSKSM